jgi:hypothetical protein
MRSKPELLIAPQNDEGVPGYLGRPRKRLPPLETYIRYGVPEQSGRHPEFRCRVGDRRQIWTRKTFVAGAQNPPRLRLSK